MIELPECYVLAEQINRTLTGKTILKATANAHSHAFAWYSFDAAEYGKMLKGKKITGANPGTGYTCGGNTEIFCEDVLLVISTPIKYHEPGAKLPAKHQLLLEFDDKSHMSCTVQMWGAMLCYKKGEIKLPEGFNVNKSPAPLEAEFDRKYFDGLFKGVKDTLSVKAFLATEQRIPGLGNGVLHDILFNARIHPKRKLSTLSGSEKTALYKSVKETLSEMMKKGGRDTEKDLFGKSGGYKTKLSNKTISSPCPECLGGIAREAYLGGNIYFCPTCQKLN